MVKRSRLQSAEAPSRRSWRAMWPPERSFHSQTLATNASRPSSRRPMLLPAFASSRSTTIWVAMPAWSVPGCQSVARPRMRWNRVSVSWMVKVRAWPMCRLPVTFGGGIMMQ